MANDNKSDYTFSDRFQRFITNLINFAKVSRSNKQDDNSPNDIFDGDEGAILTKFKEKIYYRDTDSNEFISLSDEYPELIEQSKYVLSQGVNKFATWEKISQRKVKKWKFTGYFCATSDVNCCAGRETTGSLSGSV